LMVIIYVGVYIPITKIKTELKKRDIPVKVTKINFRQTSLFMPFIVLSKLLFEQTKVYFCNKNNTNYNLYAYIKNSFLIFVF